MERRQSDLNLVFERAVTLHFRLDFLSVGYEVYFLGRQCSHVVNTRSVVCLAVVVGVVQAQAVQAFLLFVFFV